jgi:hypothetical protein
MTTNRGVRLLLLLTLAAGCTDRPQAPALRNDAEFEDGGVGLRFRAPAGWTQVARSAPPAWSADKEWLLVRYQSPPGGQPALFEVTFLDAPPGADVPAMLKEPSHSRPAWTPAGDPVPLALGGAEATRYALTSQSMSKESVVVRRGERLYFITSVFATGDEHSRELAREAVRSASWSK